MVQRKCDGYVFARHPIYSATFGRANANRDRWKVVYSRVPMRCTLLSRKKREKKKERKIVRNIESQYNFGEFRRFRCHRHAEMISIFPNKVAANTRYVYLYRKFELTEVIFFQDLLRRRRYRSVIAIYQRVVDKFTNIELLAFAFRRHNLTETTQTHRDIAATLPRRHYWNVVKPM